MNKIKFISIVSILFTFLFLIFPSKASAAISFFDDFNDGNTLGWTLGCSYHTPWVCGNWRIENGALTQDTGADMVVATIADSRLSSQILETDIKTSEPSGYGGVIFWIKDELNWASVFVYPAAGIISVNQQINGAPLNYSYVDTTLRNNAWYRLKIIADPPSGNIDVYLNGAYLFTYNVTISDRTGKTGVYLGNAGGYIDNFSLVVSETPTIGANLTAYTPPTGSQCNINVPSQYSTIQAAIDAAMSGNTICVGPGTYNEDLVISKSIRLSGRGAGTSIINGQTQAYGHAAILFTENSESNIILEGFLINGLGIGYNEPTVWLSRGSSGAIIRYNRIVSGNGGLALQIEWARNGDLIQNNILEGNNSYEVLLIRGPSDDERVLNNSFIGTVKQTSWGDSGVVFLTQATNSLIRQNAFNTGGTIWEGILFSYSSNVMSENNINLDTIRRLRLSGGNISALNAENNWWGDTDPSDNINGEVDYIPFASGPFPEYPIPPLDQPPVANAGSDQTVFVGDLVSFSGSLSSDPNGNQDIVSYGWNFGDGTTGTGITASHTYLSSGIYTVTLTVTDTAGASNSDTLTVTVQTPAQATESLIAVVQTFNLQQGIENSLDAKLSAAIDSLNDLNLNNNVAALNSLQAFINAVNAQRGNQITDAQADALIQEAQEIINHIS
ncbi:MAG: PKD domain-containing protein [Spirochaetota bacterium]